MFPNAHTHTKDLPHSLYNVIVGIDPVSHQYYSVGIHPMYIDDIQKQYESLNQLAQKPKCLAIGECGLDKRSATSFENQVAVFKEHISLAETLQKPIVIHCVKAFDTLLEIQKAYSGSIPWVIHGFNQKDELARRLIEQGFYFSLGSALLNKGSNASTCLSLVPIERLLLETDDSEVRINEIYIAAAIALNLPESELVSNLQMNCKRVFGTIL